MWLSVDCGWDEREGNQAALEDSSMDLWGTHTLTHAQTHNVNMYVNERLPSRSGEQMTLIVSIFPNRQCASLRETKLY